MDWLIEYWSPETQEVNRFSSLDGPWREAPVKHVVFVWVFLNDGRHIICLKGSDFYYLTNRIFGGFNDAVESDTSIAGPGYSYQNQDGELVRTTLPGTGRPSFVDERDVKTGVWVPGEWAEWFGLTGESVKARSAPHLREYR